MPATLPWYQAQNEKLLTYLQQQTLAWHSPITQYSRIQQAMSYGLLGKGKRLRGNLVLLLARWAHAENNSFADGLDENSPINLLPPAAWQAAAACEALHAYSLIHDDLPCMDDDDWRRGQPSCHIAFDEATAVLAGDGLQAAAFSWLAKPLWADPSAQCMAMQHLAIAAGVTGMVGGQAMDCDQSNPEQRLSPERFNGKWSELSDAEKKAQQIAWLELLHSKKTGALLVACMHLGALSGGGITTHQRIGEVLTRLGESLGLMFQIADDCLDVTASQAELGKSLNKDAAQAKFTYVTVLGLAEAQLQLDKHHRRVQESVQELRAKSQSRFGKVVCDWLEQLLQQMATRQA